MSIFTLCKRAWVLRLQLDLHRHIFQIYCWFIPKFYTDHESHKLPRIDIFLDLWLKRNQYVKILTESYNPKSVLAIRKSIGIRDKSFELFKTLATNSSIR